MALTLTPIASPTIELGLRIFVDRFINQMLLVSAGGYRKNCQPMP